MLTLEYCRQLDAADPLASLKQQFALFVFLSVLSFLSNGKHFPGLCWPPFC